MLLFRCIANPEISSDSRLLMFCGVFLEEVSLRLKYWLII